MRTLTTTGLALIGLVLLTVTVAARAADYDYIRGDDIYDGYDYGLNYDRLRSGPAPSLSGGAPDIELKAAQPAGADQRFPRMDATLRRYRQQIYGTSPPALGKPDTGLKGLNDDGLVLPGK